MRINNNVMALNAHRQLGMNQAGASKSMEKLSSGFRINRAGDDAAGLAISEKMRGQIRGMKQASRNAQDGISLIQTAEGALNETHSILQRMRELAVQSSTDTNTNADRAEIQKEIDQLATEVTRISTDTEFNTQKLLNGTYDQKVFHIGANEQQSVKLSVANMDAESLKVEGYFSQSVLTGYTGVSVGNRTTDAIGISFTAASTEVNGAAIEKTTATVDASGNIAITLAQAAGNGTTAGAITATQEDVVRALESAGLEVIVGDTADLTDPATVATTTNVTAGVLDTSKGINVSSQAAADAAIKIIDDAAVRVSAERSMLGAMQNRLEHTISNLGTSAENMQAAESRVRDLDMAEEIMAFTKNNILQQAATAMLAQANMAPQSVLQLLG